LKTFLTLAMLLLFGNSIAQTTYKDVAPIFFARCTSCHHEGGAGPFPFMTHSQTVDQASAIYSALNDGIMPPWSPDTTYTRFLHERIITSNEKSDIMNWILNATPAGDTTLAPTPPIYGESQLYGTPSMELQIPTFTSNATNDDSYVCFSLPTNLTQDRYVRAFEIIPGNASIVHHVLLNVDTIGNTTNDLSGACYTIPGNYGLGGFAPGAPPTVFPGVAPMKLGIRIKAGSKIVLQMHYPAGSAGLIDSTKVRLYFYPVNATGIRPVEVTPLLQNWGLSIQPATVVDYTATFPNLPIAISTLATFPHSHLLCTSLFNAAVSGPDTIPLIRINNWDFEWQGYYTFRYPVKIPLGYNLFGSHTYDNTVNNPNNPHNPPQLVTAGTSTTDEMFFDSFQWTYYLPGDELIDIGALLVGDTLLSSVPNVQSNSNIELSAAAFPNPATNYSTIRINSSKQDLFQIKIYDLQGNLVRVLENAKELYGSYFATWDGKTATGSQSPSGIYFFRVESATQSVGGKLIWMPEE
jgi:hypothetical protein